MGEYANYRGESVKIGTCEDMLYLRADQAHSVRAESGNVDPVADAAEIRFRFPFPDEDDVEPGDFDDPFRTLRVDGASHPDGVEHGKVQFIAAAGYNVMLPCPEGEGDPLAPYTVHRNGVLPGVRIGQQRYAAGVLATIAECGSCGTKYRLPAWADAEPVVVAIRSMADRSTAHGNQPEAEALHLVAQRITDGYITSALAEA